ncbi:hypothetical protein D3C81_1878690 [compost metagenome]
MLARNGQRRHGAGIGRGQRHLLLALQHVDQDAVGHAQFGQQFGQGIAHLDRLGAKFRRVARRDETLAPALHGAQILRLERLHQAPAQRRFPARHYLRQMLGDPVARRGRVVHQA